MKKVIQVFSRRVFPSDGNGNPIAVAVAPELIPVLGAGDDLRLEITTYARSSSQARGELSVFEGTKKEIRPSASLGGTTVGGTTSVQAVGVTNVHLAGPFHGLVDLTFSGKSASPATNTQEWIECAVNATIFVRA